MIRCDIESKQKHISSHTQTRQNSNKQPFDVILSLLLLQVYTGYFFFCLIYITPDCERDLYISVLSREIWSLLTSLLKLPSRVIIGTATFLHFRALLTHLDRFLMIQCRQVYRDAFAPLQDTRRPKPWDRASVPARAPRLQGQKIWKRAEIQIRNNKENETTVELQSEGTGARKRRKVWAVKESIKDAPWKSGLSNAESPHHGENNVEASGEDIAVIGGRDDSKDDALRSIPRKRTNTDHIIIPRKPLRQTHLNSHTKTLQMGVGEDVVDKPAKRKSMRKSARKSTDTKLVERADSTSSQGLASTLETYTETIETDVATQEMPETAPEITFIHQTSAADSENVDENGKNANEALTVKDTKVKRGRMRAISPRYSGRSTRNSLRVSSMSGDAAARDKSTVEEVESQLVSHDSSPDHLSASISGEILAQTANDVSITGAEKVQDKVQPGAVEEAIQPGTPIADDHEPSISHPEQRMQFITPQADSIELPLVDSASTIEEISVQQSHNAELEQVQITEPYDAEVHDIASPIAFMDEEASEDQQSELAGHVEKPFCQEVAVDNLPISSPGNATVQTLHPPAEDQFQELFDDLEHHTRPDAEDPFTPEAINGTEESPPGDHSPSPELPQIKSTEVPSGNYQDDDTDMLRKFLNRVKADKAAKADSATSQRKRSLPHSPLKIPLGDVGANSSPPPPETGGEFDINLAPSPTKRRKCNKPTIASEDGAEPKTIRRSGRARLPVTKTPPATPSLIPLRRMGQDGDATVTLRRNEEKELVALTRVNTRKNKGKAMLPCDVLTLKAEEKRDPVLKQRLLKEMFEDKKRAKQSEKRKKVAWAKELTQFQSEKGDVDSEKVDIGSGSEGKRKGVRVGTPKSITVKPVVGRANPKRGLGGWAHK